MLAIRFRAFALSTMAMREIRGQPAVLPSLMRFKHSKFSDKEKVEEEQFIHKKEAKDKEAAKGAKKDDKKEKEASKDAKAPKKDKDGKKK